MRKNIKKIENLQEFMEDIYHNFKGNIAFRIKHKKNNQITYQDIKYGEFYDDVKALGTSFLNLNFKNNKRIAVISVNRYEWIVTYLATVNSGNVIVPLDKGLPDQEIESLLERSKAEVLVFEEKYLNIVNEMISKKSTFVKKFICMDKIEGFDYIHDLINDGKEKLKNGDTNYENIVIDNDKMSMLLFTSGTTSKSKAVMLSHRNVATNVYDLTLAEQVFENDVSIAFLPYHHTFGGTCQLFILNYGTMTVYCDGLRYVQDNLKEYKVSTFVGVPLLIESMYKKIIKTIEKQGKMATVQKAIKISNALLKVGIDIRRVLFKEILENLGGKMRMIVSGASALDPAAHKFFNDIGIVTLQGYGLTESAPVIAGEDWKNKRYGSVGHPMASVEVKIDNPDENGLGEIIARGPNIMLGYYENDEANRETLKDGWLYTGDLGYLDKDNYLYVTGRKKNVIVLKNGKNVFPEELETLINNLDYVVESLVYGHEKNDDLLVSAKIVYDKNYVKEKWENLNEKELKDKIWQDIKEINKNLTTYKHIKNIIITDEPMIKTTTAKIKRYEEIKRIEGDK